MVTIGKKARATLHTSMGEMTLEFLTDKAPRTVENFVTLVNKGFYEGLTFHRIIKDFMIQGGCPKGDGSGGPGYTIRPEFNETPHQAGTVSMARSNDPHSAGSQFFICHGTAPYLDSRYTAFARLVDGDDVLDRIASVPTHLENRFKEKSTPVDPVYINRIELSDVTFEPEPEEPKAAKAEEAESAAETVAEDGSSEGGSKGRSRRRSGGRKRTTKKDDEGGAQDEKPARASRDKASDAEAEPEAKPRARRKSTTKASTRSGGDDKDKEKKPRRPRKKATKTKTDEE